MSIGKKIQFYRQQRGITQKDLAKATGISINMIKQYETDARNPKQVYLQKIASVLGLSVNVFYDCTIETLGDIAPYLLALSKKCNIQFEMKKDSNNNNIANGIKLSFDSPSLNVFLKQWAENQTRINDLRAEALSIPDEVAQAELMQTIDALESQLENVLLDTQIYI